MKMSHSFVFIFLLYLGITKGDIQYAGCYTVKTPGTYPGLDAVKVTHTKASGVYCGTTCEDAGFRFSGIPDANTCLCGDIYDFVGQGDCSTNCTYGFPGEKCGGPSSISVYMTGRTCFDDYKDKTFMYDRIIREEAYTEYGVFLLGKFTSVSACRTACKGNVTCTSFTYYNKKHGNSSHRKKCYGMSATPPAIKSDKKADSGKQVPCKDPKPEEQEKDVAGPAVGVGILSVLLILVHLDLRKKAALHQKPC